MLKTVVFLVYTRQTLHPTHPVSTNMCSKTPIAAIVLIVIGLFFLGRNLAWFSTEFLRTWWPVIPIMVGGLLLFKGRTPRV